MADLRSTALLAHPDARVPVPRREKGIMVRARRVAFAPSDGRGREPMVEAATYGLAGRNYYAIRDGSNPPYGRAIDGAVDRLLLRQGVAEALVRVEAALARYGLGLWLHDAWRPLATQRGLWAFYEGKIRRDNPNWLDLQVGHAVGKIVADPRHFDAADPGSWPPHSTGGAVDLVLRERATNRLFDFGAGFDEASGRAATDFFELELAAGRLASDAEPLLARRVLVYAMAREGFTNYPEEYWHFDFGTRLWAAVRGGGAAAFYRPVEQP